MIDIRHQLIGTARASMMLVVALMAFLGGANLGPRVFPFDREDVTSRTAARLLPTVDEESEQRTIARTAHAGAGVRSGGDAVHLQLSAPAPFHHRPVPHGPHVPAVVHDEQRDGRRYLQEVFIAARGYDRIGHGNGETRTTVWINMPTSIASSSPP